MGKVLGAAPQTPIFVVFWRLRRQNTTKKDFRGRRSRPRRNYVLARKSLGTRRMASTSSASGAVAELVEAPRRAHALPQPPPEVTFPMLLCYYRDV